MAWHQRQGDPAYLGAVPRTLAQGCLSVLRPDKQEVLPGKGGQGGARLRAPRAVSALPPANVRQSHSDWGDGCGWQRWQECSWPAGGTRPPLDSAGHQVAYGASGKEGGRGIGWVMRRGDGLRFPLSLRGYPPLKWGVGFGTSIGTWIPGCQTRCHIASCSQRKKR